MISMQTVVIGIAALVAVYVLLWCFIRPVKLCVSIAVKSVIGFFALFACNHIFAGVGFCVGLNAITALVCGILGVNGFLLLAAVNYFIH